MAVRERLDKSLSCLHHCRAVIVLSHYFDGKHRCCFKELLVRLQRGCDVDLTGIGERKKLEFWIITQIFPFLFKALLFIHFFFLQQQITEAVLKIKVLFSCFCKKKNKSAQNLRTVQNEALICHVNGGGGTLLLENLFCLFQ